MGSAIHACSSCDEHRGMADDTVSGDEGYWLRKYIRCAGYSPENRPLRPLASGDVCRPPRCQTIFWHLCFHHVNDCDQTQPALELGGTGKGARLDAECAQVTITRATVAFNGSGSGRSSAEDGKSATEEIRMLAVAEGHGSNSLSGSLDRRKVVLCFLFCNAQ